VTHARPEDSGESDIAQAQEIARTEAIAWGALDDARRSWLGGNCDVWQVEQQVHYWLGLVRSCQKKMIKNG
jgi:hypothetical protein